MISDYFNLKMAAIIILDFFGLFLSENDYYYFRFYISVKWLKLFQIILYSSVKWLLKFQITFNYKMTAIYISHIVEF